MSQTHKVIRSGSRNNGMATSPEPFSRVFDIGSRGRHARSAAGAVVTALAHGGIALFVFWCGDLAALAVPLEAEEFTIEQEPAKPPPPVEPAPPEPAPPPPAPVKAAARDTTPEESEPAPEAAQAGALLTKEPDESEES